MANVCRDLSPVDIVLRRGLAQYDVERAGGPGLDKPLTSRQQRIRELEAENRRLREDNIPLKSLGLLGPGTEVIHRLIDQGQKEASVSRWCREMSICRSSLYRARRRRTPPKACGENTALKAAYQANGGSRRLMASLRAQGRRTGCYRVRRLMRQHGLRARWKRKFVHTTNSRHRLPMADNVLQRQFRPAAVNQAWVADITYVRTRVGWFYLATVMDLYSRKSVG